jgi:hypothetical protein
VWKFDLLGIALVHGWLVDPQDRQAAAVFGTRCVMLLSKFSMCMRVRLFLRVVIDPQDRPAAAVFGIRCLMQMLQLSFMLLFNRMQFAGLLPVHGWLVLSESNRCSASRVARCPNCSIIARVSVDDPTTVAAAAAAIAVGAVGLTMSLWRCCWQA